MPERILRAHIAVRAQLISFHPRYTARHLFILNDFKIKEIPKHFQIYLPLKVRDPLQIEFLRINPAIVCKFRLIRTQIDVLAFATKSAPKVSLFLTEVVFPFAMPLVKIITVPFTFLYDFIEFRRKTYFFPHFTMKGLDWLLSLIHSSLRKLP
jgi:hypothetical protein